MRGGADKVHIHHDASGVLGAGLSAFDAASERGHEKGAGAFGWRMAAAREDWKIFGVTTTICSAISSVTSGTVVDGEGGF